jgi:Uma2 family endonuclease
MKEAHRSGVRRWSRHEYARLIDHGLVDEDEPIELLDGLLLVKEPQHSRHRTAVILVARALERAFGDGWFVQTQSPIILDDRSEPEPDVCVVRGAPRDYALQHPTRPALIVEVADAGLRLAKGQKASAYARARITDYWIVNLVDTVLEVHREPARPGPARRHWGYAGIRTFGRDDGVTPLAAPGARVLVADLMP